MWIPCGKKPDDQLKEDLTKVIQGDKTAPVKNVEPWMLDHADRILDTFFDQISDLNQEYSDDGAATTDVLPSPAPKEKVELWLRKPARRPKASLYLQTPRSPVIGASPGSWLKMPAKRFKMAAMDHGARETEEAVPPTDAELTQMCTMQEALQLCQAGEP